MDESRRGGDAQWDDEPREEPAGAQEPPDAPPSSFPTFGRSPGWEREPDPYAGPYGSQYGGRPREQPSTRYDQPYQQTYQQPYQQPYDQGYGYSGYADEQPPAPYPGYGYPGYAPHFATETETGAIVALILAILSWVACPVLLAIPALIVASNSRAKIRSFPDRFSGLGLITAARVVAWINIGLFVGVMLIGLLSIVASTGS